MNEFLDPSGDQLSSEEKDIDRALRPESFDDFVPQTIPLKKGEEEHH